MIWCAFSSVGESQKQNDLDTLGFGLAKHSNVYHMGLSENSVPLHPMVHDHYPY